MAWFASYLSDRTQAVVVNGVRSVPARLDCGVPQGSCLGPSLFTIYVSPLPEVVAKHEAVELDQYSDDSQLRIKFKNSPDAAPQKRALATLSACVDDVTRWLMEQS